MLILPHAPVPIVWIPSLKAFRVLDATRHALPARAWADHVPFPGLVNLAADQHRPWSGTDRAGLVVAFDDGGLRHYSTRDYCIAGARWNIVEIQ